jgi:MFS family permease
VLYLLHANRTEYPLLDPKMFRYPLFRTAAIGGSTFRIGIGAIPFLLPLMLQLGFGLSPFESGMITFVGAIGAITSKFFTQRVFSAFGFPRVLTIGAILAGLFIAINGFFFPSTPVWLIMVCLLVGGLFRSMQFTGLNALSFADVEQADISQATAINAVMQQLTQAFGVALAGGILSVLVSTHGGDLRLSDFHIAFWIVGTVSAAAGLIFLRLPADAGKEVSGHRKYNKP